MRVIISIFLMFSAIAGFLWWTSTQKADTWIALFWLMPAIFAILLLKLR